MLKQTITKSIGKGRFKDALILDFDGSVSMREDADSLDLREWEEGCRYFSGFGTMARLEGVIREEIKSRSIFLIGSGDFHHISYLLIKQIPQKDIQVVVFDNHTDNMFFPAGIHCGSWVYHTSRLPNVAGIAVFGIASGDISGLDLIQNRFSVIRSGKVKYYCLTPVSGLARLLGDTGIEDIRISEEDIPGVLKRHLQDSDGPVYLSIDKDVLRKEVVATGWDQGLMTEAGLLESVAMIAPSVIAADIAGDISSYSYRNPLKKLMRWVDGHDSLPDNIEKERLKHRELNMKILAALGKKYTDRLS